MVSSGLYRLCPDSVNEAFDIARVEQEMAESAQQYTTLIDDDEILTEIQHFGGATNLIDFTNDYLIALFFASAASAVAPVEIVLSRKGVSASNGLFVRLPAGGSAESVECRHDANGPVCGRFRQSPVHTAPLAPQSCVSGSRIVTVWSESGSTVISHRSRRPSTRRAPEMSPFVTVNDVSRIVV